MEWMLLPLKRYFEFSGRSRRKEYWMFTLFSFLLQIFAYLIDSLFGFGLTDNGPVGILVSLALFIPGLAVSVRRLHDVDRSGWWFLIILIPLIGAIVFLVWACTDGTTGSNRFGSDPKGEQELETIFS
jgi:uncharacterized membrane protein YhaH (DUF805 family)